MGYTPELVTAVALFGEDPKGTGQVTLTDTVNEGRANGGGVPAKIWKQYTTGALDDEAAGAEFDLEVDESATVDPDPTPSDTPSQTPSQTPSRTPDEDSDADAEQDAHQDADEGPDGDAEQYTIGDRRASARRSSRETATRAGRTAIPSPSPDGTAVTA